MARGIRMSDNRETVQTLGEEFARLIREEFSAETLGEIRRRNASPAYAGACATHDFSDANLIMAQAFETVTGREAAPDSETDCRLWNAAWDYARKSGFTAGLANLPR